MSCQSVDERETLILHRNRTPWYDTRLSYNPAVHRIKQAQFHAAIVEDLNRQPVPPPHPELLKYFQPPRRVLKHARPVIAAVREAFDVKEGRFTHQYPSSHADTEYIYCPSS